MTLPASVRSALAATLLALGGCAITDHAADRREAAAVAAYPPQGRIVEVDGVPVHYVRQGAGPELVLIHGASGNLRDMTFDLAPRAAAAGYAVTAFDRPGLGYTGRLPGTPTGPLAREAESPLEQARLLKRAAAALGIERPIVLGHSYGGAVALAWALDDLEAPSPAAAAAVVDLAGVAMPWPGPLGPFYRINGGPLGAVTVPLVAAFVPQSAIEGAIAGTFRPQSAPPGYAEFIGAPLTLRRSSLRANVRQVNTLRPHVVAMAPLYPRLTLPIEIVHGDADRTVPLDVHSAPLARLAPGAALTVLPGVGHMPHHAAPEAALAAIGRAAARAGLR